MPPKSHAIEAADVRSLDEGELTELNAFQNAIRLEARPGDPPLPVELTIANARNLPKMDEVQLWLVRDEAEMLVAVGSANWEPEALHNRHILDVGIEVLEPFRRRGIGTELLAALVEQARELGKTLLLGGSQETIPAGRVFAERVGAQAGQEQRISRLLLDDVDPALVDRWVSEGPMRAPGYELVFVEGDIPDELIDDALTAFLIMNTAPRDDLDMEDWVMTTDHIRQWEAAQNAAGATRYTTFVRHIDSGALVGFTEVLWNSKIPGIVQQLGTAVDPAHRGHALGKWLKADMLQRIRSSGFEATEIRTGNAESNDAMLGINVALGFRPWHTHIAWQLRAEDVGAYLASAAS